MLTGRSVTLRQVREADLDVRYAAHTNIRNRGAYFPPGVMSQSAFRGEFADALLSSLLRTDPRPWHGV